MFVFCQIFSFLIRFDNVYHYELIGSFCYMFGNVALKFCPRRPRRIVSYRVIVEQKIVTLSWLLIAAFQARRFILCKFYRYSDKPIAGNKGQIVLNLLHPSFFCRGLTSLYFGKFERSAGIVSNKSLFRIRTRVQVHDLLDLLIVSLINVQLFSRQ